MFDEKELFQKYIEILINRAREDMMLEITEVQAEQFVAYGCLLLDWNNKINLTAIVKPKEIIIKHFLDSLVFVKHLRRLYPDSKISLIDIGTGAGFPGIPIKITQPEIKVLLLDSQAKRLDFLNTVVKELRLEKIDTYHSRAEDLGRDKKYRETFDIAVVRAVAELPVLLEYAAPFLKTGGRLIAAKGIEPEKNAASARKALQILNCEIEMIDKYSLAEGADYRSIIIIQKKSDIPESYPRPAGKAKKRPLGFY